MMLQVSNHSIPISHDDTKEMVLLLSMGANTSGSQDSPCFRCKSMMARTSQTKCVEWESPELNRIFHFHVGETVRVEEATS